MMTTESWHWLWMILVMAAVTYGIRLAPFVLFGRCQKPPELVLYLGNTVSPAAIAMLVVYCFGGVRPWIYPWGVPELTAAMVVIGVHVWKKNPLVSICLGTMVYMVLLQWVFVVKI